MKIYFPYIVLFTALLISCTGSWFSIYGLGKFYGGHQIGATILAFAIEFGNIITAASLKYYWKYLPKILKFPLIVIVIILTSLTSFGIYGYLSDGYQKTAMKDEVITKKTNLVQIKKDLFQNRIADNKKELESINLSLEELSKSYNINTQTERIDKKTGQKVTNVIVGNKKGLDNQLNVLNYRKSKLDSINFAFQDSIQRLELVAIELQANNNAASELGPLKYLSQLLDTPMNKIANWLTLSISLAFQPLALMLILVSMFAFKNNHYYTRRKSPSSNLVSNLFEKAKSKFRKGTSTNIKSVPKRKSKFNIQIDSEENNSEYQDALKKAGRKTTVTDNDLTPDIAEHIKKSLDKKK